MRRHVLLLTAYLRLPPVRPRHGPRRTVRVRLVETSAQNLQPLVRIGKSGRNRTGRCGGGVRRERTFVTPGSCRCCRLIDPVACSQNRFMSPDSSRLTVMPVTYATATAETVAVLVAEQYGLKPVTSILLNRGFNDIYGVTTDTGSRFVLRLSGHRARGPADVAAETAFLAYLDARGVPVSAAVPTCEEALFTVAILPDGARPAVLFRYAEGRRPDLDDPDDARAQRLALARVHQAAADFHDRAAG